MGIFARKVCDHSTTPSSIVDDAFPDVNGLDGNFLFVYSSVKSCTYSKVAERIAEKGAAAYLTFTKFEDPSFECRTFWYGESVIPGFIASRVVASENGIASFSSFAEWESVALRPISNTYDQPLALVMNFVFTFLMCMFLTHKTYISVSKFHSHQRKYKNWNSSKLILLLETINSFVGVANTIDPLGIRGIFNYPTRALLLNSMTAVGICTSFLITSVYHDALVAANVIERGSKIVKKALNIMITAYLVSFVVLLIAFYYPNYAATLGVRIIGINYVCVILFNILFFALFIWYMHAVAEFKKSVSPSTAEMHRSFRKESILLFISSIFMILQVACLFGSYFALEAYNSRGLIVLFDLILICMAMIGYFQLFVVKRYK